MTEPNVAAPARPGGAPSPTDAPRFVADKRDVYRRGRIANVRVCKADNPALAEAIAAALDRDERAEDAAAGAPPSPAGPSAPSDVRADVALIRHHIPGFAVNALRALDRLEAAAARAGAPPADTTPTEFGACVEWCPMCRKASEAGGAPPAAPTWPADAIRQAYIAGALLTVEFPEHDLPQVEEYADVYMAALRPPQEEEPQP